MPTPDQVLQPLLTKLGKQKKHAKLFGDYYSGQHRIQLIEDEYRDVFGLLPGDARLLALRPPDTNVAAVGVDALSERLAIESFAVVGGDGGTGDQQAVDAARKLFDECDLDVQQSVGNTEALIKGRSFLLGSEGRAGSGTVVSLEDASQVAVLYSPEPPYDVVAGVKLSTDPWTGRAVGKLWVLPDPAGAGSLPRCQRYDLTMPGGGLLLPPGVAQRMGVIAGWQLSEPVDLPWTEVPIGEVGYRTRLLEDPRSYIEPIASLADSYALLMAYLVIAARYGAIPIRTLAGVPLPRHPVTGAVLPFGTDPKNPELPPRRLGAQNALASEDPKASFGQLEAGQLAGFISAIESILASIVAINRVPQHYYGRGASSGISGETLKTSEAGLDRRVDDVTRYFGQPWRKIASLAVSTDLGRTVRLRPSWKDTRTRIDAQLADALGKYKDAGIDLQTSMELLGFDPVLIAKAVQRAAAEQAQAQLLLSGLDASTGVGGDSAALADPAADPVVDDLVPAAA
ncbi:MAG: phage portal protein [Propionibacteriaceae bacterium]|nr:MAG: phage portal protein [Propionibacteriaceae bacterium]